MRTIMSLLGVGLVNLFTPAAPAAELKSVSSDEARVWIERVIPLPHEISIANKVGMAPADIGFKLTASAGEIERQAALELTEWVRDKTGAALQGTNFIIVAGVADAEDRVAGRAVRGVERLRTLPNADQAYLIQPWPEGGLTIAGTSGKGVYYGVQTLLQLLGQTVSSNRIEVPLAKVVDWPDFDERGLWNNSHEIIPWMASLKLNFGHVSVPIRIDPDGKGLCPPLPMQQIQEAAKRAFHLMPHLAHFDLEGWKAVYERYPELKGIGDGARNPGRPDRGRCPCASNPLLASLIGDWLESAAAQGPREFSLWLTEYTPCQCGCERCLQAGPRQFQRETEACVKAWQRARKQYPDLAARIFFTLGNCPKSCMPKDIQDAAECLALVPDGMKIEKVYGGAKQPFHEAAAQGKWVATYGFGSGIPRSFDGGCRFFAGSRIRASALEYYSNRWSGVYSLSALELSRPVKGVYEKGYFNYRIYATAEWTWNAHGRDLKQFIAVWAARQGLNPPEVVAEWILAMEPLEAAVSPMRIVLNRWVSDLNTAAEAARPGVGANGFPSSLPDTAACDRAVAACERALPLAQRINDPSLACETRYVQALYSAARQVRLLADTLSARTGVTTNQAVMSDQSLAPLHAAVEQVIAAFNQQVDVVAAGLDAPDGAEQMQANHARLWRDGMDRIARLVEKKE